VTALDALQTTLAGEHAALYVYGALGGRTSASTAPALYAALREGYDVHRAQRDRLSRTIRDLGAEPVAAAPAYDLPEPLDSEIDVQRAAQDLEQRCAATYAAQVAQTVGDERRWAIGALTGAAVRRLALGGDAEAFPGLDEPAEG
jgi:hypothetical protein